jgi:short-subunit dehydrogenase
MSELKERYGPWALLVGGSESMGERLAVRFGEAGVNSILVARNAEALATSSRKVRETGAEVRTLQLDISRDDVLERIREVTDDLEVGFFLHNVSGGQSFGSFVEQPVERALAMVGANPLAVVKLTHHFGKPMADRGRGGILFFGSFAGFAGSHFLAAYAAAKAFNQIFSEGLWAELQPRGVDVLSYIVGLTNTPSLARSGLVDKNGVPMADPVVLADHALELILKREGPVAYDPNYTAAYNETYSSPRRVVVEKKRAQSQANHPDKK